MFPTTVAHNGLDTLILITILQPVQQAQAVAFQDHYLTREARYVLADCT